MGYAARAVFRWGGGPSWARIRGPPPGAVLLGPEAVFCRQLVSCVGGVVGGLMGVEPLLNVAERAAGAATGTAASLVTAPVVAATGAEAGEIRARSASLVAAALTLQGRARVCHAFRAPRSQA